MTCSRKTIVQTFGDREFSTYDQPGGRCPEHGGIAPYDYHEYCGSKHGMAEHALECLSFGCLTDRDFDVFGEVLRSALESWTDEAERRGG